MEKDKDAGTKYPNPVAVTEYNVGQGNTWNFYYT